MADHLGYATRAIIPVLIAGAFISLVLRFYVRTRLVRRFGWEDGFMILAFAGQIIFATCIIAAVHWGAGQHLTDIPLGKAVNALKWLWISQIGYSIGIIAVRVSIALVLLRFIVQRAQKWIIYITLGCNVVTGLIVFFISLFQCQPIDLAWNPAQSCDFSQPVVLINIVGSIIAVVCDFSLAIVPMVLVWSVSFSKQTKLALLPIFGLACCASVGAVVQIYYLIHLDAKDFTYSIMNVVIAAHFELALAIMAGNLVTVRPLYRQITAKLGRQTRPRNFFKLKSPNWTSLFTYNNENEGTAVESGAKRKKLPRGTGESFILVDSADRERPKPLEHIDQVLGIQRQADRINSADGIYPLVAQLRMV